MFVDSSTVALSVKPKTISMASLRQVWIHIGGLGLAETACRQDFATPGMLMSLLALEGVPDLFTCVGTRVDLRPISRGLCFF